jgi:hypothetical protein
MERWIASSRSLSSGAHWRGPLAPRNDGATHLCVLATRCAEFCNEAPPKRRAGDPRGGGRRPPQERGREDRVRAAPAVSCAKMHIENAHEHTGSAEAVRPSLRSGFTAYFVLSPVIGHCCHRHPWKLASHGLDASLEASGPHDFAVRDRPSSPKGFAGLRRRSSTRITARDDASRPPHPVPRFVTIASRPS